MEKDDTIRTVNDAARFRPEAVIVGNGDFPTHPVPLRLMDNAPCVVCCDGAANRYLQSGRIPFRIVGDGDSINPLWRERHAAIIRHNPDQETNDQTKAVHYLHERGTHRIAIVGATGRREDHTLGNISLLATYHEAGLDVHMYTDHGVFVPAQGNCRFHARPGAQVSIFSFGTQGMRAEGLKYPVRDFTSWWQGTLNEALTEEFTIRCSGTYLVFINY